MSHTHDLRRYIDAVQTLIETAEEWRFWLTDPPARIARYAHDETGHLSNAAEIAKAQTALQALLGPDDTMEVWRAMRMRSLADFGVGAVGRYFTYRKQFADAYDGPRGGSLYRLHGRLSARSINWPETLGKFGSGEFEITAQDGKPFFFLDIDLISNGGNVLDADLRPELAGHTMLTGPSV